MLTRRARLEEHHWAVQYLGGSYDLALGPMAGLSSLSRPDRTAALAAEGSCQTGRERFALLAITSAELHDDWGGHDTLKVAEAHLARALNNWRRPEISRSAVSEAWRLLDEVTR